MGELETVGRRKIQMLKDTSSVTRFYCLTQFFNFVVRATFPLRGRHKLAAACCIV